MALSVLSVWLIIHNFSRPRYTWNTSCSIIYMYKWSLWISFREKGIEFESKRKHVNELQCTYYRFTCTHKIYNVQHDKLMWGQKTSTIFLRWQKTQSYNVGIYIFTYLSLEVQCKNMHCVGCTWTEGKHVSHYTKCIDIPQGLSQHQED